MASNKSGNPRVRESHSILKSSVALLLVIGCLWAAQWQFHRGTARHARNTMILSQESQPITTLQRISSNPEEFEWRHIRVGGRFNGEKQILLRNHYSEGKYGFEVLTSFTALSGQTFWVDRGWVQAGATATDRPEIPPVTTSAVEIIGRVRLDRSLPQGNFFAVPTVGKGLISEANAQSSNQAQGIDSAFYLDLIEGNFPELTPAVPAELPELSDGPHFAYALQWVIFAGLVIYGRFLIRREVLPREEL